MSMEALAEMFESAEYVAEGFTIYEVEDVLDIPHSTISWRILHKLADYDAELYDRCMQMLNAHKHVGGRRKKCDRAEASTAGGVA